MIQEILVLVLFGFAVAFMLKKFFWKGKKKGAKACGSSGSSCGC